MLNRSNNAGSGRSAGGVISHHNCTLVSLWPVDQDSGRNRTDSRGSEFLLNVNRLGSGRPAV